MPSPFPGMAPSVESPSLWPRDHYRMPGLIADYLQPQLAPRSVALAAERVYLEEPEWEIVPDASVWRQPEPERGSGGTTGPPSAAREAADLPLWVEVPERVEVREYFVEIRALPGQELVTVQVLVRVIDVLSAPDRRTGPAAEPRRHGVGARATPRRGLAIAEPQRSRGCRAPGWLITGAPTRARAARTSLDPSRYTGRRGAWAPASFARSFFRSCRR